MAQHAITHSPSPTPDRPTHQRKDLRDTIEEVAVVGTLLSIVVGSILAIADL